MKKILLFLALAGCSEQVSAFQLKDVSCTRPEQFGAVTDDGIDDRLAVQEAIDRSPGCVDLGPGRYDISRNPSGLASLTVRGTVSIIGIETTLSMLGSGILPGKSTPSDWVLMQIQNSVNVAITGVRFSGINRIETEEQTHLLQLAGPTESTAINDCEFDLPGPLEGGDCIRLLGSVTNPVRNTILSNIRAPRCFRSWLGIQRGVYGVLIRDIVTEWVGDQAIDSEPTGGKSFQCSVIASDITVEQSIFHRGVTRGITISIAGDGCAVMDNVVIRNTEIADGGIDIYNAGRVTLSGLQVQSLPGPSQPAVLARNRVESLLIENSELVRDETSTPGPVLQISAKGTSHPVNAVLNNVIVRQYTSKPGIHTEGLENLTIRNSTIAYQGQDSAPWSVSSVGVPGAPAGSIEISDSVVYGSWKAITNNKNAHLTNVTVIP